MNFRTIAVACILIAVAACGPTPHEVERAEQREKDATAREAVLATDPRIPNEIEVTHPGEYGSHIYVHNDPDGCQYLIMYSSGPSMAMTRRDDPISGKCKPSTR